MLKKLNGILNILICLFIGAFAGHVIYVCLDYRTHPRFMICNRHHGTQAFCIMAYLRLFFDNSRYHKAVPLDKIKAEKVKNWNRDLYREDME